jgi:hypothetical protein
MRHKQCKLGWSRSVIKGTLLFRPKQFFVHLSPHIAVVWVKWHMALPAHAVRAVQVGRKSFRNEGHFTHAAETLFRPYLPSHCIWVTELWHMALPENASRAVRVILKSVSKKGILLFRRSVSSVSPFAMQLDDLNMPHGTPCACATSNES